MKKRVFSGAQPTGTLHIGNYLGAIKNWVELQNKYDSIFCVVDLHALTVKQVPQKFRKKIIETAAIYLAAGIDSKKSIIFTQSYVPEHTELTWILNTITKIPELERMTQFKEKSQQHLKSINVGLFDYPVLMAADILLYQTEIVPVGEDQIQHVELAAALADRFNTLYGKTFIIPKALLVCKEKGVRIKGLDNPKKKMSKSATNPNNYIALVDSPKTIRGKIQKAVTDSGNEVKYDLNNKPAISNLLIIYHSFSNLPIDEIEKKYKSQGYAQFKADLAEIIIDALNPFQDKLKKLLRKPDYIEKILNKGAEKAQKIAEETMRDVRKKIGLI